MHTKAKDSYLGCIHRPLPHDVLEYYVDYLLWSRLPRNTEGLLWTSPEYITLAKFRADNNLF